MQWNKSEFGKSESGDRLAKTSTTEEIFKILHTGEKEIKYPLLVAFNYLLYTQRIKSGEGVRTKKREGGTKRVRKHNQGAWNSTGNSYRTSKNRHVLLWILSSMCFFRVKLSIYSKIQENLDTNSLNKWFGEKWGGRLRRLLLGSCGVKQRQRQNGQTIPKLTLFIRIWGLYSSLISRTLNSIWHVVGA